MLAKSSLEFYEAIGKVLGLITKVSIAIGFIVLNFYLLNNSIYPENLSLGDGILFIVIAGVFGSLYLFFVSSITALGAAIFQIFGRRPSWHNIKKLYGISLATAFFALFGGYIIYLKIGEAMNIGDYKAVMAAVFVTLLCGYTWRRHQERENDEHLKNNHARDLTNNTDENSQELPNTSTTQLIRLLPFFMLLILPLLFGFGVNNLANATMRAVNVRQENVHVHIKEPYITYMQEHHFKGENSAFGNGYRQYNSFTVVLKGIGENVFLRRNDEQGLVVKIPKNHIMIIPVLEKDEKNENIGETVPD